MTRTHPLQTVFGPLPSRRLGYSLGVDIIPKKTCTLDCIYCELGRTDKRSLRRKVYVPASLVVDEVREALSSGQHIDVITFSGSGEPTLNAALGSMIRSIKEFTKIPVAVLTNGTLLHLPDVREDLLEADIVLPTLVAASPSVFEMITRPHPGLRLEEIIEGLKIFRREFEGQIWLEVVVVRDMNDSSEEARQLKRVLEEIRPDRIQLNTVVRPPSTPDARPASPTSLAQIQRMLGPLCEIIGSPESQMSFMTNLPDMEKALSLLRRRPMTLTELGLSLDSSLENLQAMLNILERQTHIRSFDFEGRRYFATRDLTS